jgi:3-carboxy-cis,cis-muconate cycloisomerase
MAHEQERAAGAWHAEWRALPRLFVATHGALVNLTRAVASLEPDPARMRANIETTRGLVMTEALAVRLAERVGKTEARRMTEAVVARAVAEDVHLEDALLDDREIVLHLLPEEITEALDPAGYLGMTDAFVDRVLAAWDEARDGS